MGLNVLRYSPRAEPWPSTSVTKGEFAQPGLSPGSCREACRRAQRTEGEDSSRQLSTKRGAIPTECCISGHETHDPRIRAPLAAGVPGRQHLGDRRMTLWFVTSRSGA